MNKTFDTFNTLCICLINYDFIYLFVIFLFLKLRNFRLKLIIRYAYQTRVYIPARLCIYLFYRFNRLIFNTMRVVYITY